jgi:basic amino acid/polyamine antiporter, APA family
LDFAADTARGSLKRQLGLGSAMLLGLGSILGTGIFVSLALAVEQAGPYIYYALLLAGLVACANGLSSAQLAASHPVSGGTYSYGYRYLGPLWGYAAGWLFLCAKTASAAAAALGFSAYVCAATGIGPLGQRLLAVAVVLSLTLVVSQGLQRSNVLNAVLVALTLLALGTFVVVAGSAATPLAAAEPLREYGAAGLLHGAALIFVAFTGYGRVATLGAEVLDPRRTIPRAVLLTLGCTLVLYLAVAGAALHAAGAVGFAQLAASGAPLELVLRGLHADGAATLVKLGASAALLGVLLNLVLGLSRVVYAMALNNDAPAGLAVVNLRLRSPQLSVFVVGAAIAGLAALGSIESVWSFSALTVLVYYAITNLAALRLPTELRTHPRWVAWFGLLGCCGLAAFIEGRTLLVGLGLLLVGLGLRQVHQMAHFYTDLRRDQ